MLYLKAQQLSEIQDVFTSNPLQDEKEINVFYQDATEARTGDTYSGFVEKMDFLHVLADVMLTLMQAILNIRMFCFIY